MASLVFRNGPYAGKSLTIPPGKVITMGRNRDIELPLPDLKLSRRHCQIEAGMAGYILRDMGSTNGTYLNGQRVSGEVSLRNFDRVLIGDTEIEFQCPEEMEDLQTRVGQPDPQKLAAAGPVSNALEPITGALAVQPNAPPLDAIPIPVPMQVQAAAAAAQAAVSAELGAALQELDRPLPPEPGSAPPPPAAQPQLYFCDQCDGSIPAVDLDLGMAKEIGGKLYCKECLARGVSVLPEPSADAAIFTDLGSDRGASLAASVPDEPQANQDLDEILKGLEVEEVIAEDVPSRAPKVVVTRDLDALKQDVSAVISGGSTRRMRPLMPDGQPRPAPPPPPVNAKKIDELLGDDFEELEEIGDPLPPPPSVPKNKPVPKPQPKPATKPPGADEDEDLIEIGSSGPG